MVYIQIQTRNQRLLRYYNMRNPSSCPIETNPASGLDFLRVVSSSFCLVTWTFQENLLSLWVAIRVALWAAAFAFFTLVFAFAMRFVPQRLTSFYEAFCAALRNLHWMILSWWLNLDG